jgi:hypothetical protein
MKNGLMVLLVILLTLNIWISGCLKSEEEGEEIDGDSYSIDEDGGYIIPEDGGMNLFFMPGSVSEQTEITVSKSGDLPDDDGVIREAAYELGPGGVFFSNPVRLSINYSGLELPDGIEEYMLRLARVSEDGYDLIPESRVDPDSKMVTGEIISFSKYTIVGRRYGMTMGANPERIAANGEDISKVGVVIKKMQKGDTSEPTGEVVPDKNVRIEIINEKGMKSTGANIKTNQYGLATFDFTNEKAGTYRIRAQSTYEKLQMIVYVKVGGNWPYYNGFDDEPGEEWSLYSIVMQEGSRTYDGPRQMTTEYAPKGGARFLGKFTQHELVLRFDDLPEHYRVVLEYDFIAIGPWQGGYSDQTWAHIKNDPDEAGYVYCSAHISIQEDDFTGGFDENDIINTLGYDTSDLVFEDQKEEEVTLERGDGIFPIHTNMIQHMKDSIEIAITVDERGFGEDSDQGQYWGIDNIYVRLWTGAWI